jgi:hypothetical protein
VAVAVEPDRVVDEPVIVLGAVVAAGEADVVEDGFVADGLVPVRVPPDDVELFVDVAPVVEDGLVPVRAPPEDVEPGDDPADDDDGAAGFEAD